jgi:HD-GYP domain-containing protein (c-di-GMP phosphodiesterase class II)
MSNSNTFVPIQLSTLVGDVPLAFDVYIKVDERCLLYVRTGDDIETDRLKALKKKKVRKLFITGQDEPKYQGFLDSLLLSTEKLNSDQKAGLASGVAENASEVIYRDPKSQQAYTTAEKAANNLIDIISQNQDVLLGILKRDGKGDGTQASLMHAHAVNVCSLSISFGEELKFNRSQLATLGIASLFHDVGFAMMKEADQALFFKDFKSMSHSEQTSYKQHPLIGAEALQDKPFANAEVLGLIATHEERVNGSGFPKGVNNISPLQECHALCCLYDRQVTCLGINPEVVINDLMVNHIGAFNLDVLKKFKSFLKNVYKLGRYY